ncbi:hypothetical protein [Archaeoglobus sp.]
MKLKDGVRRMKRKDTEKISIPNATIDQMFEVIRALIVSSKTSEMLENF